MRAMGRFSRNGPPLLSRIYRPSVQPDMDRIDATENPSTKIVVHQKHRPNTVHFSDFYLDIPLAPNFVSSSDESKLDDAAQSNTAYFLSNFHGSSMEYLCDYQEWRGDRDDASIQFNILHLQSLLVIVKKLLSTELLTFLDSEAQKVIIQSDDIIPP
ncbi:hypothetical protein QAD02_007877 [Eretmocerus hayati]|uniref:Uncharacterized protein n=1 Tax=Eretmocerus hayati TaxID=131215 RepID=A0ACC2N4V8_9HYME|nr:hypothetical protein QAD02_007877 [Eretmocerus hayati]